MLCSSDTKGNRMLCCIACSVALQLQLGGWQTSEGSEQKCMQRGEPYERTYRRGDRSINTEAFTAEGGRREDQGAATLKGLPRGGGRSEQYPKAFGFGGEKNSGG